jgi:hypothetical protein
MPMTVMGGATWCPFIAPKPDNKEVLGYENQFINNKLKITNLKRGQIRK